MSQLPEYQLFLPYFYPLTFTNNSSCATMRRMKSFRMRKQHNCRKCFVHDIETPLKGHIHCPYKDCVCNKCKIISTHRSDAAVRVNALRNRRRITGDPTKLSQSQNLLENQYTVADSGNVGLFQRMPTLSVNETCAPTSNMQAAYNLDINNFPNTGMNNPANQQISPSINVSPDLLCWLLLASKPQN